MAIDVLNRLGKNAVTGILGKNLRRIAGNVGSLIRGDGGSDSSETAPINRTAKSTKMLSFPIDIGTDPGLGNHGHYILFLINESSKATLKFGDETKSSGKGLANMAKEANKRKIKAQQKKFDSKVNEFKDISYGNVTGDMLNAGLGGDKFTKDSKGNVKPKDKQKHANAQEKDSTVMIEKPPHKRLDTCIAMYMPASVKTSYTSNYTDTGIGSFTKTAFDVAKSISEGTELDSDQIAGDLTEGISAGAMKMLSEVGGGIKEALEISQGKIITDRMELAFKGVDKREFTYDFKMKPRSKKEADKIAEIIYAFKFNMLPEFGGPSKFGRTLIIPNTFDIQYMYVNAENQYLHKIAECYLSDMDVEYGGAKYKTFDGNARGAPPVQTSISLTFKEIELITREKVMVGF